MKIPNVSRRTFLEVSAASGAVAAAAPSMLNAMENDLGGKDFDPVTAVERKAIPTGCHVCNIQDGAIAYLENDRVVKLVERFIKVVTYHVMPRSNLFQRNTTGDALISAMPLRMRCFRSSLDVTRMCRRNVRAILEKAHSIRLSHEPCLGV